jgi:GMP synthase-like glutamine amidotransferase
MDSIVKHVLFIDPAVHTPELDCFNRMARCSPIPLTYHLPALHGMASVLRAEEDAVGLVIGGSASSVHDELAWRAPLAAWLMEKMRAGLPTFGICYGHQLIAQLFGGAIAYHSPDQHKRVGFETVSLAANPLWGPAREISLYVSHREIVTHPGELQSIASRPEMPFDGLAHPTLPIWTLQPHPEATAGFGNGIAAESTAFADGHALVQRFLEHAAKTQ